MSPMLRVTTSDRYAPHSPSSLVAGRVRGGTTAAVSSAGASSFWQAASSGIESRAIISRRVVVFISFPVLSGRSCKGALPLCLQRVGHRWGHEPGDIAAKAGYLAYQR